VIFDTTELFNGWVGKEVIAYVLRPGGPPTSTAPEEGESGGGLAYPLGVGTKGDVLRGFDERGIVVDSGSRFSNTEELRFIPWSALFLELKLAR
jgi:hypothetical protein